MIGDHEDSGIDSDDPDRLAMNNQLDRLRDVCFLLPSDSSSSDDESGRWRRVPVLKRGDGGMVEVVRFDDANANESDMAHWPTPQTPPSPTPEGQMHTDATADRASPPLYEVELTASDEDDDTSVLELVIPVQSSRYQRVPTSSPMKVQTKSRRLFCGILCCVRK